MLPAENRPAFVLLPLLLVRRKEWSCAWTDGTNHSPDPFFGVIEFLLQFCKLHLLRISPILNCASHFPQPPINFRQEVEFSYCPIPLPLAISNQLLSSHDPIMILLPLVLPELCQLLNCGLQVLIDLLFLFEKQAVVLDELGFVVEEADLGFHSYPLLSLLRSGEVRGKLMRIMVLEATFFLQTFGFL